jgi:hypothetical protein
MGFSLNYLACPNRAIARAARVPGTCHPRPTSLASTSAFRIWSTVPSWGHRPVPMQLVTWVHAISCDAVQDLIELFRHNTWANAKVFDLAASLDSQPVTEVAPGTRDTVLVHSLISRASNTPISGCSRATHRNQARKCTRGLLTI